MDRVLCKALVIGVLAYAVPPAQAEDDGPEKRLVLGGSQNLSRGASAIRAGRFDEGIRLTLQGLEEDHVGTFDRAAGLANLCAAYVAREEPDTAIPYCDASLQLNRHNWKTYSNRSHAYLLKGMYAEARFDNDAASAISPEAAHVRMIRQRLNELTLEPHITIEEHP